MIKDEVNKTNDTKECSYINRSLYRNNEINLGTVIIAFLISVFAVYLSVDIITQSRKVYSYTVTLPAHNTTETVFIDTAFKPIDNVLKVKLVDVNTNTSLTDVNLLINPQDNSLNPLSYKVSENDNITATVKVGQYYDLGLYLNENIENDVEVKVEVEGIYEP